MQVRLYCCCERGEGVSIWQCAWQSVFCVNASAAQLNATKLHELLWRGSYFFVVWRTLRPAGLHGKPVALAEVEPYLFAKLGAATNNHTYAHEWMRYSVVIKKEDRCQRLIYGNHPPQGGELDALPLGT